MQIRPQRYWFRWLKRVAWYIFQRLENNGNADRRNNGEEHFLQDWIKQAHAQPCVVLDVGANVGEWSEALKAKTAQHQLTIDLHLFEPLSEAFAVLQAKFGQDKAVYLNPWGISAEAGTQTLFVSGKNQALSSLYDRRLPENPVVPVNISLQRLDTYIAERQLPHIDLLKIDTEGNELRVLQSLGDYLKPGFVRCIQFEYGATYLDARTSLREVVQLLTERGYRLMKIMPTHLEPRAYEASLETFQYANFVAM